MNGLALLVINAYIRRIDKKEATSQIYKVTQT